MRIMHVTKSISLLLTLTLLSGAALISSTVSADDDTNVVDQINITVPVACTISGTGMNTHNANINNGIYTPDIGTTTLHAFCNDSEGFAIYAAGYTGNGVGGTNSNKLVGTSASNNATIETGLATTAGNPDVSNWAMKLAITGDSGDTSGTNVFTIDSAPNTLNGADASFNQYHVVPNEYTKVAHKDSNTDMATNTGGVKLTTTYAAYISKTQPADTYSGQVIYTLIHPSSFVAGKLNVIFDGNGLIFNNGEDTNLVSYEATTVESTDIVTQKVYTGSYDEEGNFNGYSVPAGNEVVTIDGAESIHIAVTFGAPQGSGGPPSDLYIWAGNHPDYTNANNDTSLANCGATYSINGAFSSNGQTGSQITMECDIASDSITFYDYSASTNNTASMGYYAVISDAMIYDKTAISGAYQTPVTRSGQDTFLGWSTNPNANADAEEPLYINESDFIGKAPYLNTDGAITMYAVWGKTFNTAFADAGKTQLNNHYKMQDATDRICKEVYVGATETLVDIRDNATYVVGRLKDGNCWMLDNLALDPTNATTASIMSASNTNATNEAIANYLTGGSVTPGWSSAVVTNVTSGLNSYIAPMINNASKNTLVTSYGPASVNGQAKVGIYYNYCAATVGTYCYEIGSSIDLPDTMIDAPQDICPANWRMPTGGDNSEYYLLSQKYSAYATDSNSVQYSLSTPLSGAYYGNSPSNQNSYGSWWSSTHNNANSNGMYSYEFSVGPLYANSSASLVRNYGTTMRCLVSD